MQYTETEIEEIMAMVAAAEETALSCLAADLEPEWL